MKTRLVIVALTLSLIFAGAACFYLWFGRPDSAKQKLADAVRRSEYVYERYNSGDYTEAKAAVLDQIRFLDQSSDEGTNPSRKPHDVDAMLWYVRLAKLEEKNNGVSGEEFMQEAINRCDKFGWVDCSQGYLRHQVDRMDEIALAKPGR